MTHKLFGFLCAATVIGALTGHHHSDLPTPPRLAPVHAPALRHQPYPTQPGQPLPPTADRWAGQRYGQTLT